MASTASFTATNPPDGYCPVGNIFQSIVAYLNTHTTIALTIDSGTAGTIFYTDTTPSPVAGAIWFRKNSDSFHPYFTGVYTVWNGRWVPIPNKRIGEVMWTIEDPTGLIDSDGKGLFVPASPLTDTPNIAGGLFGYQLMNNNNGSVNLKNRFPMAGYKYDSGWVASVKDPAPASTYSDQSNGGREGITITLPEFPVIPVQEYDGTKTASSTAIYGGSKWDSAVATGSVNFASGAQQAIQPINPLYRVLGAFQWIGYAAASA